jgi:hypothetical protein
MILTEKLKQGKWVLPDGTAETEDSNGTTFVIDRGVVLYKNNNMPPKVEYIVPQVSIDNAIKTYKETLSRISRDTDLSMAFFDARELGTQISAKSLRTNMFRTELKAKSMTTMLERPVKQLICKFALANGIDLDVSEFSVTLESGFVQDIDEQVKLIQARGGVDTKSMTQVDVIKAYDSSMSISQAQAKANEINGIKDDSEDLNIEVTDSGKDSEVTDGIGFSATSNIDKKDGTKTKPVYLVEV